MIVTNVDKLLDLLHERKQINVKDAANVLGAKEKQIEKIANYLLEEGIISVDYKLTEIVLMASTAKTKKGKKLLLTKTEMKNRSKLISKSPPLNAVKKKEISKSKTIVSEKQPPVEMKKQLREIATMLSKKGIEEKDFDLIDDSFKSILGEAVKEKFYNKTFFNKINQFYELIESKKIISFISSYTQNKDVKSLDSAKQHFVNFVKLQNKLNKMGYAPNLQLKEQLKRVLDEITR